MKFADR